MLVYLLKSAIKGKTLVRSLMNHKVAMHTLTGTVLDIGGGHSPSYMSLMKRVEPVSVITADIESGSNNTILNLEKDSLPFDSDHFSIVLLMNVLEHIYEYKHVAEEAFRVLKTNGTVIGFVPFMVNVHPDPHDFFRYTNEALLRIFSDRGFKSVSVSAVGYGPFCVGYNSLVSVVSAKFLFWLLPVCIGLDTVLLHMRPNWGLRFALGYFFTMQK